MKKQHHKFEKRRYSFIYLVKKGICYSTIEDLYQFCHIHRIYEVSKKDTTLDRLFARFEAIKEELRDTASGESSYEVHLALDVPASTVDKILRSQKELALWHCRGKEETMNHITGENESIGLIPEDTLTLDLSKTVLDPLEEQLSPDFVSRKNDKLKINHIRNFSSIFTDESGQNGVVTVVSQFDEPTKTIFYGLAICSPGENFCKRTGIDIASSRMYRKKDTVKRVKSRSDSEEFCSLSGWFRYLRPKKFHSIRQMILIDALCNLQPHCLPRWVVETFRWELEEYPTF